MKSKGHSQILGVGGYLPEEIVTSESLMDEIKSERFNLPASWLEDTLGIVERRYSPAGTKPSDLALQAACMAVEESGVDPHKIGLVIYCAIEKDQEEPATAHRIQAHLAPNAMCWDVSSACHGFMDGLSTADAFIGVGTIEYALVVTGETSSRACRETIRMLQRTDPKDIETALSAIGFLSLGDGGGAMVLGPKHDDRGVVYHCSYSAGKHRNLCHYRYGTDEEEGFSCHMNMPRISSRIILAHRDHIDSTFQNLGWQPDDVTTLITHQVGKKPLQLASEHTGVSRDRMTNTLTHCGNLTSATIPINLWRHKPTSGEKLLILGAGSGTSISQWGVQT